MEEGAVSEGDSLYYDLSSFQGVLRVVVELRLKRATVLGVVDDTLW